MKNALLATFPFALMLASCTHSGVAPAGGSAASMIEDVTVVSPELEVRFVPAPPNRQLQLCT